jgi:hypothetical protein
MKKPKSKGASANQKKARAFTFIPQRASDTIKAIAKDQHRTYAGQLAHVLTGYADDNTLPEN